MTTRMARRFAPAGLVLATLVACSGASGDADASASVPATSETEAGADPRSPADPAADGGQAVDIACQPQADVEGRPSPYDSVAVPVGSAVGRLCYSRPALRGRTMIGGEAVPYGKLWRTGANEPTTLHLPVAAEIAGMRVAPGAYSIYTIPGQDEWVVIVNRSTSQWGIESQYTADVRAQEVGRATVKADRVDPKVETFTIRAEPGSGGATNLLLEWQNTRVTIPVRPVT